MGGINTNRGPKPTIPASQVAARAIFDGLSDYFEAQSQLENAVLLEGAGSNHIYPDIKRYEHKIELAAKQFEEALYIIQNLPSTAPNEAWLTDMSNEISQHLRTICKAHTGLRHSNLSDTKFLESENEGLQESLWHEKSNAHIRKLNYDTFEGIIKLLQAYVKHVKQTNGDA